MRPEPEKFTITIAEGTATAKMTKGSFRHHDSIRNRRRPVVTALTSGSGSFVKDMIDPATGRSFSAVITEVGLPDGCSCRRIRKLSIDTEALGANRLCIEFKADPEEHIYGCGEVFSEFDLKGHKVRIWVAEHQNALRITDKMMRERLTGIRPDFKLRFEDYESYYAQPTFVSGDGYFVHVDGNSHMEFDFRRKDRTVLLIRGSADIYIGEADSFEGLSEGISLLLGKQPAIPDYLHDGIIIASQRGNQAIEKKIELAKTCDLPLTGFWCQDWCGCRETAFGYQVMWNWEYDSRLYPDLPAKIAEWKKDGIRFFGYINPFMAIEGPIYAEASEKGYCVKNAAGDDYMVTITTFPAAMIDLTNPDAVRWYKDIIKNNMIGIGMSGWMADFGEYLPTDAVLWSGEASETKHNEWPALWAKLNREVIDECGMGDEIFFFVRAGHSGTIANAPVIWNGDQHTDWSKDLGIGSVIPASLSLAMSGAGVCHSDIGGYTAIRHMKRSKELYMRWAELCCFSPLMRMHEGNRPDANVQFDADTVLIKHVARMGRLHTALKDYLKAALAEYYDRGIPVMRPVFYGSSICAGSPCTETSYTGTLCTETSCKTGGMNALCESPGSGDSAADNEETACAKLHAQAGLSAWLSAAKAKIHTPAAPSSRPSAATAKSLDPAAPSSRPSAVNAKDGADLMTIDDEYLLGSDILAAPVLRQGALSRSCTLPEGEWIHLFTGDVYHRGTYRVEAPMGKPPVFIKKSSPYAESLLKAFAGI